MKSGPTKLNKAKDILRKKNASPKNTKKILKTVGKGKKFI